MKTFHSVYDSILYCDTLKKTFLLTAEIDGTTTKDMYKEFGLNLED